MHRIAPSPLLRFIATSAVILLLTAHFPVKAQQKASPPSPHSQTQLEDRVKELETRLDAAEQKAGSAAMEKDYILRTQSHYETYYKEVFSTQTHILWTIGITVTLLSVTLSVVFFVAGRFGFNIFDRRIDLALRDATAQLRTEFTQLLEKETHALREVNAAQLEALEEGLTKRITDLEDGLSKRITQQEQDLEQRSQYQFQFAQGLAFHANDLWDGAIRHFRSALELYKAGKPRGIFRKFQGNRTAANIFKAIRARDKAKFVEAAKKELELDVYKGLEDELNFTATEIAELVPLLKERNLAPSTQVAAEQKTAAPQPTAPRPPATAEHE